MILSLDEALQRLNSADNISFRAIKKPGPSVGSTQRTVEVQAQIASDAHLMTMREVAEKHGVSIGHVNRLKQGSSDGEHLNPELVSKTEENLMVVKEKAVEKMMLALGLITAEKVEKCSAKDLASITASMANVVERVSPKKDMQNSNVLVIYAPQMREEAKYEVQEI